MIRIVLLILLVIPATTMAAQSGEFKCLDGAEDSGPYKPGNVVRYCSISNDGRLLYHGSVWRWYRNGQPEGKEFYILGNAEGEWPSWYENGKPSSLGKFKDGNKTGLWKYWNENGWLETEVIYTQTGNLWTEYYPIGRKKASGKSTASGKIGVWTYWDADGKQKAKCDFGNGLFALPSKSCQFIASKLEPKGYSQPVPVATTTPGSDVNYYFYPDIPLFNPSWMGCRCKVRKRGASTTGILSGRCRMEGFRAKYLYSGIV